MAIIIFILAICIFVLYNKYTYLKKETDYIKDLIDRYTVENATIKDEIEAIKKRLEGKIISETPSTESFEEAKITKEQFVPEVIQTSLIEETSLVEEIVPIEVPTTAEELITTENTDFKTFNQESFIFENQNEPTTSNVEENSIEEIIPVVEKKYVESAFSKFIKKAEKQFADNWTGILGTAIMVLGIGYLSIYTALKVSPLFRILILWLYAGILVAANYFLHKKEKWVTTGLWLRSAGASLFLFGCYGASQIPALAFISNSAAGYFLIAVGILINLYIGYIIKKQTFLSLHVVLSILILCVIPEKTVATFVLASITAIIGIILSYKEKWEFHLLIVIITFIVFDIWFNAQGTKLSPIENILAILGIISVAGSCMVMQYRSVYENTVFDKAAFITHLTNWLLFAIGLILHSTGSHFKTFVLLIGAIICFIIALKARKKKIFWLYHLDGMVSFILLSLSIIMLNDWKVGIDIIVCILYLLVLVCLFVVYNNKETLLYKIFLGINQFMAIGLTLFILLVLGGSLDMKQITNTLATIIIIDIIAISVPIFSNIKKEFQTIDLIFDQPRLSLNGLLAIVFSIFLIIKCNIVIIDNLFVIVVFGIALIWCYLKQKFETTTFDIGRVIFYGLSILIGIYIINNQTKSYFDFIFGIGLFIVIVFNWNTKLSHKNDFIIRFIGIVVTNVLLLLLDYKYLSEQPVLQIFSLFGIAVLNHEFLWLNYKKNSLTALHQTILYYCYFLFIILGSLLFLNQTAPITNIEIGLSCLGITIVELYILFTKRIRNKSADTIEEWTHLNLYNSEFIIFNLLVFGYSCLANQYISVYLAISAIIFLIGFQKLKEFKRFNLYSFLLLITGLIMTVFIAFENINLKNNILTYITQTVTILLSFVYSFQQFKSKNETGKKFLAILPYIQNVWVIILLFIQVELSYLPLLFLFLGLINYWLITTNKIKITFHIIPTITLLAIIISLYYSFSSMNAFTVLDWGTQLGSVFLNGVLIILLSKKETNENVKIILTPLPYIQNLWLIILLFTQVEIAYLPLLFMALALINYWLMTTNKVKIAFHTLPAIALLAIIISLFYSFRTLNSFTILDWVLQLGSMLLGLVLVILLNKKETNETIKTYYQIILNIWLSTIMFSQLPHKWLPIFWGVTAIMNLYLYHRKISKEKNISIVYYLLANLHLGFLSFNYFESRLLAIYILIFTLLAVYIYLAYKWVEDFKLKNSLLIYPATLSIGCFLYLTFDKGILTFFWILEALGLLILGILLKEKYFRYVSLSLVGVCLIRLMFFDLSNADFLIRALVLLGVGVVLLVMNSLFKKYKDRFD